MNTERRRARLVIGAALVGGLGGLVIAVWPSAPQPPPVGDRVHVASAATWPAARSTDCYPQAEPWENCEGGRIQRNVVFDWDTDRGNNTCRIELANESTPPGSSCQLRLVNLDPNGGPGRYVEYDDDPQRGVQRCIETLRHDLNERATCEVQPTASDPAVPVG